MADVVSRMHGNHGRDIGFLDAVPHGVRGILHRAAVTEEHMIGAFVWWATTPAMAAVAAFFFGRWGAAAVAVVLGALPVAAVARRSDQRAQLLVAALPDMVDQIGRSLRSGASLRQALIEVSSTAESSVAVEMLAVLDVIDLGRSPASALQDWSVRVPTSEVRIVAAALALASENEAGTTRALDGVSQTLRDRSALTGEIRSLISQAVTSMRALLLLPVGFLALDAIGDQRLLRYLTSEPIGRLCLLGGIALNLVGSVWMHLIVRRQLPA